MKKDISREEKIEKAIELRREGRSYRQIGEWLGVHNTTVMRWCEEFSGGADTATEKITGDDNKLYSPEKTTTEQREERRQEVKQLREQGEKILPKSTRGYKLGSYYRVEGKTPKGKTRPGK